MLKLWNMLRLDLTLVIRDKIALYMAVAPVLLSLIFMAVIGGSGAATVTFAVAADLPPPVVQNLERLGRVERVRDFSAVVARVERMDSAAGLYLQDGSPTLLLEGNEPEGFGAMARLQVARAITGDIPAFASRQVDSAGNQVVLITAVSMLLLAIFIAGAVSGQNIVNERESMAIRALAISPLNLAGFLGARTAVALLLALANVTLCAFVLGVGGSLPPLLLATLASAPVCGLIALILGVTASNQISAFATLKLLVPAALALPITSLFVPEGIRFLYWWLPMYWQYEAIAAGYAGRFESTALILTLLTGLMWMAVLSRFTGRRLGLR